MAREIVYFNNGEVYKEQSYFSNTDFDPEDKFTKEKKIKQNRLVM